jgi:hypothetical protein
MLHRPKAAAQDGVEFGGGQEKAEMHVVIFRSSDGILHGDETRQDCRSGVINVNSRSIVTA